MRTSEHYELNLVEGTDKVNPLVQDVPNYETIDEAMYNNKRSSIGIATELRTGTVHALVRQNEDAPMFRFTATSNYASGDTFTVDGVQVSALLVDGTPLPNMAYIIGSEVLCVLKGTLMTVFANRTTSSDSDRLGGELPSYYATDSKLDALEDVVEAHTEQITQLNSDISWKPLVVTNFGCTIPLTAKEVTVAVWDSINNIEMSKVFAYNTLDFSSQEGVITILEGWYFNLSNCGVSSIKTYTNNYLALYSLNINGSDVKNSAQISVYYR